MKNRLRLRNVLVRTVLVLLAGVAAEASAQLEIGGKAFEPASPASSDSPEVLLTRVQRNLQMLGYDPGPIGTENRKTTVAITTFQVKNGLEPDGAVSSTVDAALRVAVNAQHNGESGSEQSARAAGSTAGESPGEDAPCVQEELADVARKSKDTGRRIGAFGRLLKRAGVDSDVVEDVGGATSELAGAASDGGVLSGPCK